MKSFIQKTTLLLFITLSIVSCSKKEECDPEDEESPCYAGLFGNGKGGTSECSYKIKIDGKESVANQFGKDKIVITSSPEDNIVGFSIFQKKTNTNLEANFVALSHGGPFNSKSPVGSHNVGFFGSTDFTTPQYVHYPFYGFGENDYDAGKMTYSILENSDKRIRMKVSGTAMKQIADGDGSKDVGLVPVEGEITVARKYVTEGTVNGVLIAGAVCECQN